MKKNKLLKFPLLYITSYLICINIFLFVEQNIVPAEQGLSNNWVFAESVFLVVIPILLSLGMVMLEKKYSVFRQKIVPTMLFISALFVAWWLGAIMTEEILVPWDNTPLGVRPDTKAMKVNNFFEDGFGATIFGWLIVLTHIILFVIPKFSTQKLFSRMERLAMCIWTFILANLLVSIFFGVILSIPFPNLFRVEGLSYLNSIFPLILHAIVFIWYGVFLFQELKKPYEPLN